MSPRTRALLTGLLLCAWGTASAQTGAPQNPKPTWATYRKQVEQIRDSRPGERRALTNRFRTINRSNKFDSRLTRRGRVMTTAMAILKGGSHVEALDKLKTDVTAAAARGDERAVVRALGQMKHRQGRVERRLRAANRVLGHLGLGSWARAYVRVARSMQHHDAVLKETGKVVKQHQGWLRERATEKLRQRNPGFAKNLDRIKALDTTLRDIRVTRRTVVDADGQLRAASTRRKVGAVGLVGGLATGGAGWIVAGVGGTMLARGAEGRAQQIIQLVGRNLGCLKANKTLRAEGLPVLEGGVDVKKGHGGATAFLVPHYSVLSNLFFNNRGAARQELGRLDRGLASLEHKVRARRQATYETINQAIDREVQSYAR